MATAEIIRNSYVANTKAVVPILGGSAPGTTQDYEISRGSEKFPTAIFFAPQQDKSELNSYWGDLLQATAHAYYVPLPRDSVNTIGWDRLNLELMRIASLPNNWDGEGAEGVSGAVIDNAQIVMYLAKEAAAAFAATQCHLPSLIPSVEGCVILKWAYSAKELKCTITTDGIEVVRWGSPNNFESDGYWELPVNGVSDQFEWLFK